MSLCEVLLNKVRADKPRTTSNQYRFSIARFHVFENKSCQQKQVLWLGYGAGPAPPATSMVLRFPLFSIDVTIV